MKNKKRPYPLIIKTAMVILLTAYLLTLYLSDSAANIPMENIAASMEAKCPDITSLGKCGRVDLKRFYQIEESAAEGYFFYKAPSPMAVEEILIIKASDKKQAEAFLESAQNHLSGEKKIFEGYGTDQMALLNEAIVESRGNYVYYMCGANAGAWRDAFLDLI